MYSSGYHRNVQRPPSLLLLLTIFFTLLVSCNDTKGKKSHSTPSAVSAATVQFSGSALSVDEAVGTVNILVSRSGNLDEPTTISYITADGSATAGSDYLASGGTLEFQQGEAVKIIAVEIIDDYEVEGNENLVVTLSNASAGSKLGDIQAIAIDIIENDIDTGPGVLEFSTSNYLVAEGTLAVDVIVNRTLGSEGTVTVDYDISDGSASAGADYTAVSGTLTFAEGQLSKTIQLAIIDDSIFEETETIILSLTNPLNGAALGANSSATVSITENEPACTASGIALAWPFAGDDGIDWVISNYVDNDITTEVRDYMGNMGLNAKTYDGHLGTDIDVSSFREMDADVPVSAVADGIVMYVKNGEFDRNTAFNSSPANQVTVRHANGFEFTYAHFKNNSIVVKAGDSIQSGQKLGVVGSSGSSTGPHLHVEIRDCDLAVVDPFVENMWISQPVYDTPLAIMDLMVFDYGIADYTEMIDPPANPVIFPINSPLTVGASLGGGDVGDTVSVKIFKPIDIFYNEAAVTLDAPYRHSYRYWTTTLDTSTGLWKVQFLLNGVVEKTYNFIVE